ncbi:MAG: tRNA (N6-isopentenyl adenosine(37)-C2)-methylthiotransferase MiaB [Lachnospirales bacterium]
MSKRKIIKVSKSDEIDQEKYIDTLKVYLKGKSLKFSISTYGCQMNAHDSEKLIGILEKIGYSQTDDETTADLIIYNTCCVRENAENKVYGNLGFLKKLKENNPNLKIILCGCMMQQDIVVETIKTKYRHVDIIFGTYNLYRFPELLNTSFETGGMLIDIWKEHGEIVEDLPTKREYKYKSSVNIMYGCNNFCTYCIVPYVRGRERSRPKSEILKEIHELVDDGVVEITLLGQNVNSYGNDLKDGNTFSNLLKDIDLIKGLKRIRFMTSHPKDCSKELIDTMASGKNICHHLHLPFQSGSTKVLKDMNRKYTKEDYLNLISYVKEKIPDITITTDIIIGFPSETEDDFLETLDVVKKVEFITSYTFIYSKREGTPAARIEEQIPEDISKDRFNRLLNVLKPISFNINKGYIGKTVNVLVEHISKNDSHLVTGRTDGNILVHFEGTEKLIGQIVKVKIFDNKTFYLLGRME